MLVAAAAWMAVLPPAAAASLPAAGRPAVGIRSGMSSAAGGPAASGPAAASVLSAASPPPTVSSPAPRQTPHPGASLRVYVLTAEPGDAIWERFGHNALRIVDEAAGTDVAWNWGLFRFDQEGFIPRLARGTMMYGMDGFPTPEILAGYAAAGRAVWSQELELSAEERWAVQRAVHDEDPYYRYDYYRDNCSTRVRDVLDAALGGRIRAATAGASTGTTYRWHTRRLLTDDLWAYAGIQLVLGNRADEPITAWQEMFLPMRLREHLGGLTVERDGVDVPLVREERQVLSSGGGPVPAAPRSRMGLALGVGLLWAAAVLVLGRWAAAGSRLARGAVACAAGAWTLVAGLAGTLLAAAWAWTDHVFWGWNENLLQMDPLALGLAAGLSVLWVRPRLPRWTGTLAGVVAVGSAVGVLAQLLPGFDQTNGEILALAVPVNLAVGWTVWTLAGTHRPGTAPAPSGGERQESAEEAGRRSHPPRRRSR